MKHLLDILLALPIVYGAINGFRKGLIFEVSVLLALAGGVYGGYRFSGYASGILAEKFDISSKLLPAVSFLTVFLLVLLLVLAVGKAIEIVLSVTPAGIMNRFAGMVLGFVKWALLVSLALYIIYPFDLRYKLIPEETKSGSFLYQPVSKVALFLIPAVKGKLGSLSSPE
jgi:membrane protein required for colicin V production